MTWDSVEIGLAGGEETVTFGPRNETGSSLYQVDTLACVSPSEKVHSYPDVHSVSKQDGFCMAISKQVLLFNSSCTVLHATLNFDYDVDRVALSHSSTFAAIGDRSGNFHFLHIESKQILFSQQLVPAPDTISDSPTFVDITFTPPNDGMEGLVILISSGLLYEFSHLHLEHLHKAVVSQDFEEIKRLKQSIVTKCSSIKSDQSRNEVLTGLTTLVHDGLNEFITYGKGSSLSVWGPNVMSGTDDIVLLDKLESLMFGSEVIKACATSDGNFLLVLDDQHMLSLWDISSLTMVAFWHFLSVADFLFLSTSDVKTNTASSEEEQKIIILTKPGSPEDKCFLQVYTLPTMKQIYSLQVSNTCFLAQSPSNQETIYFTEAVLKTDDDDEDTIALRVRCLTEALPESRFYRLLHKHQFEAAEKFAKQFNLDFELVHKVKANTVLDKVSQWSSSQDHHDSILDDLIKCLTMIQDDEYVITCCLQAVFPTIEETYTVLQYARQRASQKDKSTGMICHPHLLNEILAVLNKLVTFENAYGIQQFSGSRCHSFCHADLLDEVKACFGQGEVSNAVIIWRRHQGMFAKNFSLEKLESLFGSIGQNLQTSLIVPWLRDHLVPFVCKILPEGTDLLASWLDQRARTMELSEKKGWPANALELVRVLPAPTYDSSNKKDPNTTTSNKGNGLLRLAELAHGLSELQELHDNYSCRISLAEYTGETTKTIVFRLLDGVKAAELIPHAMKKYIGPYIIHYGLDKDQVLLEYIQELLQKISSSYSFLSNSLWEPRVIAVISYIKDKQCFCKATLKVMTHACVPWSDSVNKLVQDALISYPNNLELKEQYRFVELKEVLKRYGVKSTLTPVPAKAKRIVRIILNRDESTAVDDALKVVGAYHNLSESDVYIFRLQKLLLNDRGDECLTLLDSLSKTQAAEYAQEIITWLCCILQQELQSELDSTQEQVAAAQNAITLLKYIKKRSLQTYHDIDDMIQDLGHISLLQKHFLEFLSLEEYQDPVKQQELVQKYLQLYLQSIDKNNTENKDEQQQKISLTKLIRLCNLVGVSKENLLSKIADHALSVGDTDMALDICRDLLQYAPEPSIAPALYKIIHTICKNMSEGVVSSLDKNDNTNKPNQTKDIYHLLCQILNICEPGLLCDCLELCKLMALTNEVYSQCETGDYGFSVQSSVNSSKKDLLNEWSFGKRFKEDGLVLDSFIALPLAAKFSMACVPNGHSQYAHPFYQDRVAGRKIFAEQEIHPGHNSSELAPLPSRLIPVSSTGLNTIRYLQENNLYKLALRYTNESIGICHQHFAANTLTITELNDTNNTQIASELHHLAKISKMGLEISKELIGALLVKVFNHKSVDHDLGLGYICAIPKQLALEKMKSKTFFPAQNYGKLAAFSDVGVDFAILNNEQLVQNTYMTIKNNALWGQKLSKMKIYIKDVYDLDREDMMRLLPDIIQHNDITIELLLDFCRSFHLVEEDVLLMYIKMQLLPPVTMDTSNRGDNISAQEYELKVHSVVHKIPSDSLVALLVDICAKIDPYDYDKIMFVLKLTKDHGTHDIVSLVEKGIQLLEYLYLYERKAIPSKYERTFTYSTNPEDNAKMAMTTERPLPVLSKKRLPFHPMLYGDPWKVISAELSDETVPKLIGVAKLLKLSRDQMYLIAIQNLFKSSKSQEASESGDTSMMNTVTDIDVSSDVLKRFDFEVAKGLLYAVKNKEMAIAAAKWISQQLPLGEEKIKVLETCVDLANDWKTNCLPEELNKANKLYERLKELSRGMATEYVLHKYNIADPSLVVLVSQPAKLICQLYENYGARDIETRSQPPDINKAADQIATINNSSIAKIRLYLIERWLPSRPDSTDESLLDVMNQTQLDADENSEDANNLKRAVYILQDTPPGHSAMFLLNFAYTEMTSTNISCKCRLRSLQALFATFQDDIIEEVAKKSVASIRQYMKSLTYMAEFEALHIQQSLSAFQKCNKEGLVRGLWRNHNHEKRGVRLVADLCLDNEIHDSQLWNSVLQHLLSFGMINYLRHVLVSLSSVPELWLIPCLPHVWRSVLLAPFKNVSPPLSDEELKSCQESAVLLQRCPLLFDLDLVLIAQHFHRVGLEAYALACLVLIPFHDKQRQKVKDLLDTKCGVVILDQLKQQCDNAKMLGHVKTLQEEVCQYIEDNQDYELLLNTIHFEKLMSFLVNTHQLEGLLMKTIKANRLANAQSLVHLYHQVHPTSTSGQFITQCNEKLSPMEELMTYLECNQRLQEAWPYLPQPEEPNESIQDESINEAENSELFIHA